MRLPILLLALMTTSATASSEAAWEAFRADVETACAALAPADGETAIEVNPFGSENYGAALLITALPDGTADRYVCIYDKREKTAELTAPFTLPHDLVEPVADEAGNVEMDETTTTESHLIKP
ncbi:hypothetical protein RGQ15_08215 [Paracoccus sp. MBLB3053]|uniref:Uncharacterized protein n=1 Tax=Paracoccus aurantius TaxID=3073814 RepID=A0ABU2HR93_9RHOB|nr:hypothetical protein [Paracoccus sp. MBLB3053]MDS9467558.1 hypothetical protein [Paracoccus sp. MBLB3053]